MTAGGGQPDGLHLLFFFQIRNLFSQNPKKYTTRNDDDDDRSGGGGKKAEQHVGINKKKKKTKFPVSIYLIETELTGRAIVFRIRPDAK